MASLYRKLRSKQVDVVNEEIPDYGMYTGQWKKGQPHGSGTLVYTTFDPSHTSVMYCGMWNRGQREGQGTLTFHTQNVHVQCAGTWNKDKLTQNGHMSIAPEYKSLFPIHHLMEDSSDGITEYFGQVKPISPSKERVRTQKPKTKLTKHGKGILFKPYGRISFIGEWEHVNAPDQDQAAETAMTHYTHKHRYNMINDHHPPTAFTSIDEWDNVQKQLFCKSNKPHFQELAKKMLLLQNNYGYQMNFSGNNARKFAEILCQFYLDIPLDFGRKRSDAPKESFLSLDKQIKQLSKQSKRSTKSKRNQTRPTEVHQQVIHWLKTLQRLGNSASHTKGLTPHEKPALADAVYNLASNLLSTI
eukprot:m.257675 g.257675  ORF g.257675 m.257675 type:complete len:358 (-) comp15532_c0_seq2:3291-4364(-)